MILKQKSLKNVIKYSIKLQQMHNKTIRPKKQNKNKPQKTVAHKKA